MADRLFKSVSGSWSVCVDEGSSEVKELTPEWYSSPAFLRNANGFDLGSTQAGAKVGGSSLCVPPRPLTIMGEGPGGRSAT